MRRLHLVLLAALVAVLGAAVGIWKLDQQEAVAQSPREHAAHLLETCQWAAAVDACDALLASSADDGEVYFWRGRAHVALGQNDAAIEDYSAAIAKRPLDAEPLYCRGMVYERIGKEDLADADYEAARRIDPRKDKLAEAIREEETAADVRRVVRDASRHADERADRLMTAKNSLTQQRTAALRESHQADQMAVEVAASEKANASSTANLHSNKAADATANQPTWAGVDVASPFAEKPTLPHATFSPFGDRENSSSANMLAPGPFRSVNPYGEGPAPAADSADAAKDVASSETKEASSESAESNDAVDPTAEQSLSGQSIWQQLQQQSVQRGLAATTEGADSHTLFLGPRLAGPFASDGNGSGAGTLPGSSTPGYSTPGGFGTKPNLPSSMPSTPATNEPAGRYPIQSWSAPQYGFSGMTSQPANGLSGNNGQTGQQSGYAQNVGPNNAPNRPLVGGTTGGIALANGPVPGGPVLRPVAMERQSTPSTVNSRRELAGQLSTASAPLPAPAVDRSSAKAASRPGVLSTAIYEIFQPSTPAGEPQLSTHTSPLPVWTPPPVSAPANAANRATPSKPPATSGLPMPQLPSEDFGKAAMNGSRRNRSALPELRLPEPAATRSLRASRSK